MKLSQPVTLGYIAKLCGGRLIGDENITISSVSENPNQSTSEDIALVFDKSNLSKLSSLEAKAFIIPASYKSNTSKPTILVDKPLFALKNILQMFEPKRFIPKSGIDPTAIVDDTAIIEQNVAIGPYCVIGPGSTIGANSTIMAHCVIGCGVAIGENCLIYPMVVIADYVKIGSQVILQQGVSVGADGFGYVTKHPSVIEKRLNGDFTLDSSPNPHFKIPQIGNVIIEDDVEIGSNSTVARATIGSTKIMRGTKIDSLVLVAHNVVIGEECLIAGLSGIAGSTKIGNKVVLGGACGIKDHLSIGDEAIVEAKAAVMRNIPAGDVQTGIPSVTAREHFKEVAHIKKLPVIYRDLKNMRRQLKILSEKLNLNLEDL